MVMCLFYGGRAGHAGRTQGGKCASQCIGYHIPGGLPVEKPPRRLRRVAWTLFRTRLMTPFDAIISATCELPLRSVWLGLFWIIIYIYIYICVCVCAHFLDCFA